MDFLEQVDINPSALYSTDGTQEKQRLAPNEAITQGAVSSAYVENFALRVFASADSEDRKGAASRWYICAISRFLWLICCRNTAKKFLAAANFLELLKIFDPLSQAVIILDHPTINLLIIR